MQKYLFLIKCVIFYWNVYFQLFIKLLIRIENKMQSNKYLVIDFLYSWWKFFYRCGSQLCYFQLSSWKFIVWIPPTDWRLRFGSLVQIFVQNLITEANTNWKLHIFIFNYYMIWYKRKSPLSTYWVMILVLKYPAVIKKKSHHSS